MRINSIYIASFGGIKNLKLDFFEKFNIIYGNNEDGKTTVMAFIKMMFYGSERGGSSIAKNIRKKYTPWDNSTMAGSIDFEHFGKKYRLEKEFRTSNSTDKATLYDLMLSEKVNVSGDIGQKFLGLSLASFERSVFIGQFGFPESDTDAEGELSSKLSNLALTGEENISFETVNSRLQKAKLSLMSKSKRTGEYDKNIKTASDLEEQIRILTLSKEEFQRKINQAEVLKNEIEEIQKTAEELKVKISAEQDIRNAEKFKKLLSLKEELDNLNKTLTLADGGIIDEMYLRKLKFCISKTETAKANVVAKENEIELLNKSISTGLNPPENATKENLQKLEEETANNKNLFENKNCQIEQIKQKLSDIENKQNIIEDNGKKVNKPLFLAGIAVALVGIILFIFNAVVAVAGLFAGIVLVILGFVLKPSDIKITETAIREKAELSSELLKCENEKILISAEITAVCAKIEGIKAALNATKSVVENQQKLLLTAQEELKGLKETLFEEEETLLNLCSLYKQTASYDSVNEIYEEISKMTENQKKIKTELSFFLNELDGISYDSVREKLAKLSQNTIKTSDDFDEIKKKFAELLSIIADKKSQYATLIAESKNYKSAGENLEVLKKKRDELKIKIKSQKEFCELIDLASETLAESFAQVHSSYGAVLERNAAEIFEKLTLGKYKDMYISKSFDIDVEEKDHIFRRDINFLSSGASDQGYLSLRLALSKLISPEEDSLPVLLDDSLAQYDDQRTDSALSFLNEYSKEQQIIMFTCHKHICEKAMNLGIVAQNLKSSV